jgi:endonuclease III
MTKKKLNERGVRVTRMLNILTKLYPKARIALVYSTTWELVVAVSLSAQCTDKMVNKVTEKLFKKYTTIDAYSEAKPSDMEQDVRQTGFYKNKAKNLINAAKRVRDVYSGRVPGNMEDLITLPGVARKTANVVLANRFNVVEGIAVDTHVRRFALRFDLTDFKDPQRIEKDLIEIVPKKEWNRITYKLIEYGREICFARKHDCKDHPLTKIYPKASLIWPRAK